MAVLSYSSAQVSVSGVANLTGFEHVVSGLGDDLITLDNATANTVFYNEQSAGDDVLNNFDVTVDSVDLTRLLAEFGKTAADVSLVFDIQTR